MSVPKEIYLKDYQRPHFWIKNTDLLFEIAEKTTVTAKLTIEKNPEFPMYKPLVLNGEDLKLISIAIDENKLSAEDYQVDKQYLTLENVPDHFVLTTVVEIDPDNNLSCEGLYKSGSIYCTQNEAQGFRKVTYYLDRPDIMSSFKTAIIADKKHFPFILSNGNLEQSVELANGKHKAIWNDPFPKPCYLFALVAGDLGRVQDSYTTLSGRHIKLEIYVDHGNENKTKHAMESLKNSMRWDEEKFGLEYDLDLYMIVAVDSFNMGAMENKGLNIFNSAYVLAKQETATDQDFKHIEGVIGHEYFHNWTGNRVTCRDWFQLTLKEGLTVFRDQEFSADMGSRAVKHIEDIEVLKLYQFSEDAGPLSHPIQPKSYIEINNFYTHTVYEKGAQVIRMIETIIGKENFRKGMDLYFKRHDGQAVTTDDFVNAMADASGYDLEHFKSWYDQNGTPKLEIKTSYDPQEKTFQININQHVKTNNQRDALFIPLHFQLLNPDGSAIELENDGKYILDTKNKIITLKNIEQKPIAIWNIGFAAPILVEYDYNLTELLTIMAHSNDSYAKYEATQTLYFKELAKLVNAITEERPLEVESKLIEAFDIILHDEKIDNEFKAMLLTLPSEKAIFDHQKEYHFDHYRTAWDFLAKTVGLELYDKLTTRIDYLSTKSDFDLTPSSMGKRALRATCMRYLVATSSPSAFDLVFNIFQNATNMTEEIAAFWCLVNYENPYSERAKEQFFNKWKDETLVIQKWLRTMGSSRQTQAQDLAEYEKLEVYDPKVPNLVRALYGSFLNGNLYALNNADGNGYRIIIDKIIEIDGYNPQLAARLTKVLDYKNKLDETRKNLLTKELTRLRHHKGLSNDTFEIVGKNLA